MGGTFDLKAIPDVDAKLIRIRRDRTRRHVREWRLG